MAEPIVSFIVEAIGKLLTEEGNFLGGVGDEAEQLHSELKMMRALLKDADEKQHEAAIVKEWISQCKDVAYEAENVLETHAFKLSSRRSLAIVKRYTCILNEGYIRHTVGLEIQSLNTRISNLTRRFQEYGIRAVMEREGSSSLQQQLRMTYSYAADDEDFVGFGPDVEKLVEVLMKEANFLDNYGVVSISGMGGSGKTTPARKIYNHPNVKIHFDRLAWVCISQQWQTRNILRRILVAFLLEKRDEIEKCRDDEIIAQILPIQQNCNCFVVLDDIWSRDVWECIKVAFPNRKKGNKILITTRNKYVAIHIGPNGYHHEPRLLTDNDSWELLQKKVLRYRPSQGYVDIHNLEDVGKEMVKVCGGLPLAVVVLGGILATKHSFSEWNLVCKNIKYYMGKGERIDQNQGEVQKILALSYNDFPYKLKPCFLCLSGISEEENIQIETLCHLWIAEGMIFAEDRIGDESMMEIAERYLGELAKRCIVTVQAVDPEVPSYRRFSACRIHDLMRDLCRRKATEENFLKVMDYGRGDDIALADSISSATGNNPRMVISLSEQDATKYAPIQLEEGKHLRTLVFCSVGKGDMVAPLAQSKFKRFKMLRSLTIEGVITPGVSKYIDKYQWPKDVFKLPLGNLIHMRCLRLRNRVLVMSPSSTSNLEHLETLNIRGSSIVLTKNEPIMARRLRHLYVPSGSDCPMKFCVSNDLEVISGLGTRHLVVKHLSELTNLREVVWVSETNFFEEIIKCISNSHHIKQATLEITYAETMLGSERWSALLEQLFSSNVQYLHLHGGLGDLPEYDSRFLRNLVALRLYSSVLREDPMEILEKLPNLERLVFSSCHSFGENIVCHSTGFPKLTFLVLAFVCQLKSWKVENGAMTNLSSLRINRCHDLMMIPKGLRFITALKELVIEGMYEEFYEGVSDQFSHVQSIVIR